MAADTFDLVGGKDPEQTPQALDEQSTQSQGAYQAMAESKTEQTADKGFGLIGDTSQKTADLIANAIIH